MMTVSAAILWIAIYIACLMTVIAIRSHLLFVQARRVLRMSEMHGKITDRAKETTCNLITELKETTTAEASEVKRTALAVAKVAKETAEETEKRLAEKIDTTAQNMIREIVTGGSGANVELHGPRPYSNGGRT